MFLLLCIFELLAIPGTAQYVFRINDFEAASDNLSIIGSTRFVGNTLRLTPATKEQQGACWYRERKIYLSDGFETEFTFLITETDQLYRGGDGFAFVIQNQGTDLVGGTGDQIGYKAIPFALVIEFDTRDNNEGSRNHVNLSFYDPAKKQYRKYATVHEIPEISDGKPHFTKIIYLDGVLTVYLDSYLFPILSVRIDIGEKIRSSDDHGWIGFTSSTSEAFANHDLIQWTFKEYLPPPSMINADDIEVVEAQKIEVAGRKLKISVWDHNRIDGDTISLKWGDEWILTGHRLEESAHSLELTLHGFQKPLILYANNTGLIPPNTAAISVYDGFRLQRLELESDFKKSESVIIQYRGQ